MILKGYIFSILYGVFCLLLGFALYKSGISKKITRKIVHIIIGFEWVILYHFMGAGIHFFAVCLIFLTLLVLSYKKNLLPMISSDADNAPGTVYYALAMSIMGGITLFVQDMIVPFGIGVFCTSFGDGLAGVIGGTFNRRNPKIYGNKTLVGALANFLVCFGVALVFSRSFNLGFNFSTCLIIGVFALELELFTGRGLDNISITLGCAFLAYAFCNFENTVNYILPILLTPLIIVFARNKRALTLDGIVAAVVIDFAISLALGNFGFTVLTAFFVGSVAIDKIKKITKNGLTNQESLEKRSDCRDAVQVFSNGGISAVCAILYFVTQREVFLLAFAASLSEAFSDTAASGIGSFAKNTFDVFRLKKCERGISGGISLIGTVSSFVSAFAIALVPCIFSVYTVGTAVVVGLAGFLGCLFDSLLGSWVQVKYRCSVCGKITEREYHCEQKCARHRGVSFVNNDVVNFVSTLFSAMIMFFVK